MELFKKESRKIFFTGDISETSISPVIDFILRTNNEDFNNEQSIIGYKREPIYLYIQTYGGDVYAGLSLCEIIKSSQTPIITYALGAVMSAGLVIYLSGHYRIASPYSTFMYHEVSTGGYDKLEFMIDNVNEAKRLQILYDKMLTSGTKITKEELKKIKDLGKDYIFDSKKALEYGLANEISIHTKIKIIKDGK